MASFHQTKGEDVGYLCRRCGRWNRSESNKQHGKESSTQQSNSNNGNDSEERVDVIIATGDQIKVLRLRRLRRSNRRKAVEVMEVKYCSINSLLQNYETDG